MKFWRLSESPEPGRFTLVYGIIIGALLVALTWFFLGPPREPAGYEQSSGTASSDSSVVGASTSSPMAACHSVSVAQRRSLRAANAAMAQWQVHIGAMNKLVGGTITLQQATQFWNQTRVDARHHLRVFSRAFVRYDRQKILCPRTGSGAAHGRLQQCRRAIAARAAVLKSARRALATWSGHVTNMNMLRNGMMSPTRATTLWLQNWHQGQREVDQYRAAVRKAQATPMHC